MVKAPELQEGCTSCEFGKFLATDPQTLLHFYVQHSRNSLEKLKNELVEFGKGPHLLLPSIKRQTDEVAFDLCSMCPGADQLANPDLEVLFQHCSFVTLWLNLAYLTAEKGGTDEVELEQEDGSLLSKYLRKNHVFLTSEMSRLQLDAVEFAALKGICIWKMGPLGNTDIAKVLSGEQYLGVAKALNEYHQTKPMQDFQKAGRLADITAFLAPISSVFKDLQAVYKELNIDDSYKGDFV